MMTQVTIWNPDLGSTPANFALKNNFAATADPTANDDVSEGYEVGSTWVNISTKSILQCLDATAGAAVWGQITQSADTISLIKQGTPVARDTAVTLTASDLLAGIITTAPAGAINLQLPTEASLDAALPESAADSAFDFSVINTDGSNAATLTDNSWTALVGVMAVSALSSARFRARKTGAGAWTLYRIS